MVFHYKIKWQDELAKQSVVTLFYNNKLTCEHIYIHYKMQA
jgi:hypothetical protein